VPGPSIANTAVALDRFDRFAGPAAGPAMCCYCLSKLEARAPNRDRVGAAGVSIHWRETGARRPVISGSKPLPLARKDDERLSKIKGYLLRSCVPGLGSNCGDLRKRGGSTVYEFRELYGFPALRIGTRYLAANGVVAIEFRCGALRRAKIGAKRHRISVESGR
jgi:hypothetical protein